jgi:hypothetical protein
MWLAIELFQSQLRKSRYGSCGAPAHELMDNAASLRESVNRPTQVDFVRFPNFWCDCLIFTPRSRLICQSFSFLPANLTNSRGLNIRLPFEVLSLNIDEWSPDSTSFFRMCFRFARPIQNAIFDLLSVDSVL